MLKDQKEEIIVALRRQITELEEQKRALLKSNEEFKKNDSQADVKIKALNEMHASKVRTLLKSIQNLKKELQKEKFEKLDNNRVKRIQAQDKEIEMLEMGMNALRKLVNNEDACDKAIVAELTKGPKRVRVASREELKIEIKKYKNMALRLLEILKVNKITVPSGFKIDQHAGTGFMEDKGEGRIYGIDKISENSQIAANEDQENQDLLLNGGGDGAGDTGQLNADLLEQKERLEESVVRLNMELREKNERLLELLEELEDVRIQVYARDKSVALQQKQIEDLLEELRDAKSIENDIKILVGKKIALEEENKKLRNDLDSRLLQATGNKMEQEGLQLDVNAMKENIAKLEKLRQSDLDTFQKQRAQLENEKKLLKDQLDNTNNELAKLQKEVNRERSKATEVTERLTNVDGESKKLIDSTRLEVEAFRQRVFELEKEVKVRDERLSTLEARVVLLSTEIADKDYEIEFYTNSIEELQNEIRLLQSSGAKPSGGQQATGGDASLSGAELETWKKKCKVLQQAEVRYLEEIEMLKAQKAAEDKERTVNNLINRNRSKSKTREEVIAENDGIE